MSGFLWFMVILFALVAAGGIAVYSVRRWFKRNFGASITQVMNEAELKYDTTPKSVSAMTRVFLPQIEADFPEFSWDEYRLKSTNAIKSALLAIADGDLSQLTEDAGGALKEQVRLKIEDDGNRGVKTRIEDITFYQTEIFNYVKKKGAATIIVQSSFSLKTWEGAEGKVVAGDPDKLHQTKTNIDLIYIQDEDAVRGTSASGAGLTCPHCGAPVKQLGSKTCAYCGAAVAELNLRVWKFGTISNL